MLMQKLPYPEREEICILLYFLIVFMTIKVVIISLFLTAWRERRDKRNSIVRYS
jgi:hypothetical protein